MLDCKTPSYLVLRESSYLDKKESSEEISSGLKENVGWDSPNMLDKPLWGIKLHLFSVQTNTACNTHRYSNSVGRETSNVLLMIPATMGSL